MNDPTESEKLAFLRYARYTAFTADKLCGSLLKLSQRLEESKFLDPSRKSKLERDRKLKNHQHDISVSDEEIMKIMKRIDNNPDAEQIVSSLFRDVDPSRIKRIVSKEKKSSEIIKKKKEIQ